MKKPLTCAFVFFQILALLTLQSVAGDTATTQSNAKRLRVVMSTDFPPIGVVKGGNVPNDHKSDPISNLAWVNENIRKNHRPLCDVYPREGMGCTGVCEGDSPAFLWLVSANRGLNNPDDPTQESWGGQFRRMATRITI